MSGEVNAGVGCHRTKTERRLFHWEGADHALDGETSALDGPCDHGVRRDADLCANHLPLVVKDTILGGQGTYARGTWSNMPPRKPVFFRSSIPVVSGEREARARWNEGAVVLSAYGGELKSTAELDRVYDHPGKMKRAEVEEFAHRQINSLQPGPAPVDASWDPIMLPRPSMPGASNDALSDLDALGRVMEAPPDRGKAIIRPTAPYAISAGEDTVQDGSLLRTAASTINSVWRGKHGVQVMGDLPNNNQKANVAYAVTSRGVFVYAIEDISAGQELISDYEDAFRQGSGPNYLTHSTVVISRAQLHGKMKDRPWVCGEGGRPKRQKQ